MEPTEQNPRWLRLWIRLEWRAAERPRVALALLLTLVVGRLPL